MQLDVFFFGTVPMPDAGNAGPVPTDRRYGPADVAACYDNLVAWAKTADGLGYDTLWLTEHHFQHEGYEVVPNLILFGTALALQTEHLRFGQMFTVVPQWHPLRLAEDFALADILTGGRMVFGVGRGTVPREAESLGTVVASGDNEMSRDADRVNRETFEEAMEVIKLAWGRERFSYSGKHFSFPPVGIPDRGATVSELTLVPRPTRDIEIFQPITSPDTMAYAPAAGHKGVYWLGHPTAIKQRWDSYAEVAAAAGHEIGPGEDRALVLNVHVGPTREAAIAAVRDGHDEFCRFLAPYGRFTSYLEPDGSRKPFAFQPTVEDSIEQRIMAIGSVDDVVEVIGRYRDELDLRHLVIFPDFPGLTREQMDEQLHLVAEEVMPRLGAGTPTP
ncbi:MAG TPA: LLM class flavin-dependent oxidoreductase [Acidimicrobiales bacterium]|nr:LLM class flavin-dependent oxidoreductase [Acidimicrobiales bacterium]